MAVKDDSCAKEPSENRDAGRQLVDDVDIRRIPVSCEVGHPEQAEAEMQLSEYSEDDMELALPADWEERVSQYLDGYGSISRFSEAAVLVPVRSVDGDRMPEILQARSSVNDETLSTSCGRLEKSAPFSILSLRAPRSGSPIPRSGWMKPTRSGRTLSVDIV